MKIETTTYQFTTPIYSIDQLDSYQKQGRLDFNLDCQRGYIWTEYQQQQLIDTLMYQERIPEIHAIKESNSRIWRIADGKQRLTTILNFVNNKLAWKKKYADEYFYPLFEDKNKLYFEDLPEQIQTDILDVIPISFVVYQNMTHKGIIKLFRKLNNGTQLSNFQKGMAENILLRTSFSQPLLKHSCIRKCFSERAQDGDKPEKYLISLLILMMTYDIKQQIVPVDISDGAMFSANPDCILDGLAYSNEEISKWVSQLQDKVRQITYYLDIIENFPDAISIRSKGQFVLPIFYAYVYDLDENELLKLCRLMKQSSAKNVIGGGGQYTIGSMGKWFEYIDKNIIPKL